MNKDAREKYVEAVQSFNKLLAFPTLLDTIGVLVDEDVIDPKVVYKLWGPTMALVWKTWNTEVDGRTPVETLRQEWGSPTAYRYFESLGRKMALLDAAELFTAAASSQ